MCVIILLQCTEMMDDSETAEDTEKSSVAEVTDDSCKVEFIEIVPLDRASDDYHKLEFIEPVVEVKPEDIWDLKQEMADGYISGEDGNYSVKQEPADETPGSLQQVSFVTPLILQTVMYKLGLHQISFFQIRPELDLAGFRNSSFRNLFSGDRTICQ